MLLHTAVFSLNVQSQEIKVPVRFSGYNSSLSDKGPWFALTVLLLFGIIMFVVNIAISIKVYRLRKSISMWMLVLNIVILTFLNLISRAIVSLA